MTAAEIPPGARLAVLELAERRLAELRRECPGLSELELGRLALAWLRGYLRG